MKSTALHEILAGLERLDADKQAKLQFKRLVMVIGATYGMNGIAHAERVDFARDLLGKRVSRATIRDRLIALFNISRSQAYVVINDALNCPEKGH